MADYEPEYVERETCSRCGEEFNNMIMYKSGDDYVCYTCFRELD